MKRKIAEGVRVTKKSAVISSFSSYRAAYIGRDREKRVAELSKGVFYATESRNAAIDGGVLCGGTGAYRCVTPSGGDLVCPDPNDLPVALIEWFGEPVVVTEAGKLYFYNGANGSYDEKQTVFSKTPTLLKFYRVDGEERLVFCGVDGVFSCGVDGEVQKVYEGKASSVACVCEDRVFFALGDEVRYSAPMLETAWTESADEAGFLKFPDEKDGEIVALAGLADCVYVLRKRGIVKVTVSGAARDFQAEKIAYGGGEILGGACTLAGKVYFLTADGLKTLDERGVEDTCVNLFLTPERVLCALGFGDRLLFRYTEASGSRRAVVVNATSGKGYFSVLDGEAFALGRKGLIYFEGGTLFTTTLLAGDGEYLLSGSLVFGNTTLGIEGRKAIDRITLYGEGMISVRVSGENGVAREFTQEFTGTYVVRPFVRGERFTMRIDVFEGGFLKGLQVDTVLCGGVRR